MNNCIKGCPFGKDCKYILKYFINVLLWYRKKKTPQTVKFKKGIKKNSLRYEYKVTLKENLRSGKCGIRYLIIILNIVMNFFLINLQRSN